MPRPLRVVRATVRVLALVVSTVACAAKPAATIAPEAAAAPEPRADPAPTSSDPERLFDSAEAALESGKPAQAQALFGRYLAEHRDGAAAQQATLGLATAHERLRDCAAAIRTHDAYLERFPEAEDRPDVMARRGACEAEIEQWERSAESYRRALTEGGDALLPSAKIELLARRGFALFQTDAFDAADPILAEADEVFARAERERSERFATYYFVGMARFYRAAILHRQFREIEIRLPEKTMKQAYERKLELLSKAQEAYKHTIRAKHMFWVSASGYQLGRMFSEFYDSLMYAPVPKWLDDRQRVVYYEELKKQLGPVITKAVWVLEKNLETARRIGYESAFIDETEAKLSDLQALVLSSEATWGKPHPRLVPEALEDVAPPEQAADLPAEDRKLYVPLPTPL